MSLDTLQTFLGWTIIIHMGFLLFWLIMMLFARDFTYAWHSRWFDITRKEFDLIQYKSIAIFKLLFFVFAFVPYLALLIIN